LAPVDASCSETDLKLSIIIPTLNEAGNIELLLGDLAGSDCEIIVVDGGSSDGTVELVTPLVTHCLHSLPGRATQLNAGAAAASGDLLLFLHADCRLPPAALSALLDSATTDPGWGRFDIRLSGSHPLLRLVEKMMNLRSRITGIATGDQGIFVSRRWFTQIGGYPAIPLMEEIALCRTLKRIGPPVCLRAVITTSSRRWEHNGVVRTILLMWWLRLAYFCGVSPQRLAHWYGR